MQHKFTKSLLATAILFGLTACGSSGGGGSSEPTTKANAAVDTAQNTTVNKSNATNTAKDNSKKEETITVPTVADNTNKNNATNQPIKNTTEPKAETKPVTAIKNIENLSGKATYTAQLDKSQSYINGERKSGKVELTADFDHKDISGKATFDMSGGYTYSTGRACRFNGQSACGTIRAYNSARANLKETLLTNNNGVLSFNGVAEGEIDEYGEITPIVGTYQGQISGENAENISGSITANASAIYGVFNGTSEELAAVKEPEPIVTNWETLPSIPKITASSDFGGYSDNITGKATYFSQKTKARLSSNGNNYSAKSTQNTYTVLNADFDTKKVSGSSVAEFYTDYEKIGQSQIEFKETNLYKNGSYKLDFTGLAEAKIQVVGKDVQNATGSYNGSISTNNDASYVNYELYSDSDRTLNIKNYNDYNGIYTDARLNKQ